jgi:hypothetical protein
MVIHGSAEVDISSSAAYFSINGADWEALTLENLYSFEIY